MNMGLDKWLRNRGREIKQAPGNAVKNYQAERAHQRVERLEERNEYEKGRHEGAFKRGQLEGAGGLTEKEKYYSQRSSGGRSSGGRSRGGSVQRTTGRGGFVATGNAIFGSGGGMGGIGSGLGFGFGDEPRRQAGPPMRTRTISPSGKVTISEPIERQVRHEEQESPYDFIMGPPGLSSKGKKEKHPYDIF
jgi:hypothetical protein